MLKLRLKTSYVNLLRSYIGKWHEFPGAKGTFFQVQGLEQMMTTDEYCFYGYYYKGRDFIKVSHLYVKKLLPVFNQVSGPIR